MFVDHVLIVGNVRTSTGTIERELRIKAGDPFSLSAINDGQRRLTALGLFRRTRITELRHGAETSRDLLMTIEEAPPTTLGYGGGLEVGQIVRPSSSGASLPTGSTSRLVRFSKWAAQRSERIVRSTFLERRVPFTGELGEPEVHRHRHLSRAADFDIAADAFVNATFDNSAIQLQLLPPQSERGHREAAHPYRSASTGPIRSSALPCSTKSWKTDKPVDRSRVLAIPLVVVFVDADPRQPRRCG